MDFIIKGDGLCAYVGSPKIRELIIPEGIRVIGSKIFQEKIGFNNKYGVDPIKL